MSKITREQVIKTNEKCGNGFELDVMYYINWGEKRFEKRIEMGENDVLCVTVSYREFREGFVPEIHAEYEKMCSDDGEFTMYSHQSGNWEKKYYLPELTQTRKNASILQKITREMSSGFIDKLKSQYRNSEHLGNLQLSTDLFLAMDYVNATSENITMDVVSC